MANLFASMFEAFGQAVEDIRHKVVEEGWFGRQVTGNEQGGGPSSPAESLGWDMPRQSFDDQWAPAEQKPDAPDKDIQSNDIGR